MYLLCILLITSCHSKVKIKGNDSLISYYHLDYLIEKEGFQYIHQDIPIEEMEVPSSYFMDCKNNQLIIREIYPFFATSKTGSVLPSIEIYETNSFNIKNPKYVVPMIQDKQYTVFDQDYFIVKAETHIPDGIYYLRIGTGTNHLTNYLAAYTTPYAHQNFGYVFQGNVDTGFVKITINNGKLIQQVWNISFLVSRNYKYKFFIRNEFDEKEKGKLFFSQLNDLVISTVNFLKEKYKLKESPEKVLIVGKPVFYIQNGPDLISNSKVLAFTLKNTIGFKFVFYDNDMVGTLFLETIHAFFQYSKSAMLQEGMLGYVFYKNMKSVYQTGSNLAFKVFVKEYLDKKSKQYYGLKNFLYLKGLNNANEIFGPDFIYEYFNVPLFIVYFIIEKYGYDSFIEFYYSLDPKDLGVDSFEEIERDIVMLFK
jgi:hypothetical protein